jgi:hypothetical protein
MSGTRSTKVNPWATGVAVFAAAMMVLGGMVQVLDGIVALNHDVVISRVGDYVFGWDADGWGWVHIILGVILAAAGFAIFADKDWARVFGMTVAIIAAVVNFMWLPYYPVAAVVMIALDVLVVWALATFEPVD